jgi:ribonuclease VapC
VTEILRQVEAQETQLHLSVINYGEVLYVVERERGLTEVHLTIAAIGQLPIEVVDADRRLTFAAAHIKASYPLAYADCFAVSLAQEKHAAVVTGDPEFKSVETLVDVEWLPQGKGGS